MGEETFHFGENEQQKKFPRNNMVTHMGIFILAQYICTQTALDIM